jgi:hypothetical protein
MPAQAVKSRVMSVHTPNHIHWCLSAAEMRVFRVAREEVCEVLLLS